MIKEYFINLQTKKLLKEALAYGLIFYFMLATCLQCHGFAIQASEMQCSKEIIFSYELKVWINNYFFFLSRKLLRESEIAGEIYPLT